VIVPDINLLVYCYNADAPHHSAARRWWEALMNGEQAVALPWVTALGFIRLMTNRRVLRTPLDGRTAVEHVRSWLARPNVEVLDPGPRHLEIFARLIDAAGTAGNLTTDAHLAALAIEHRAELHSNDVDFGRFPGLRWHDPLAS
jgi:hypothetical protein